MSSFDPWSYNNRARDARYAMQARERSRAYGVAQMNQPAAVAERAAKHRADGDAAMEWAAMEPAKANVWIERAYRFYELARNEEGE